MKTIYFILLVMILQGCAEDYGNLREPSSISIDDLDIKRPNRNNFYFGGK